MFGLFSSRTRDDYIKEGKAMYGLPENKQSDEHYRIGSTVGGDTTITLIGNGGISMTLTMNKAGCEKLIRMIRATYEVENEQKAAV